RREHDHVSSNYQHHGAYFPICSPAESAPAAMPWSGRGRTVRQACPIVGSVVGFFSSGVSRKLNARSKHAMLPLPLFAIRRKKCRQGAFLGRRARRRAAVVTAEGRRYKDGTVFSAPTTTRAGLAAIAPPSFFRRAR